MAFGIFTAPERVVRDGQLVCFKGERMTADEAERRGLTVQEEAAPDRMAELMAMSAKELEELAAEVGAEHAKGATKQVIAEAIIAKESE